MCRCANADIPDTHSAVILGMTLHRAGEMPCYFSLVSLVYKSDSAPNFNAARHAVSLHYLGRLSGFACFP